MNKGIFDNWQGFAQAAMETSQELESINTGVFEKITAAQMDFANAMIESGTRFAGTMGEMKDIPAVISEQTRLFNEINEKMLETARNTADILNESRESYKSWVERGIKSATDNYEAAISDLDISKAA